MSGEQDIRPDLVAIIDDLRQRVYELEHRISGDESPLALNDLEDVRVDNLGDVTITLADGSALVYRSSDKMWIPGSAGGGGGGGFPITYDDGTNNYEITAGSTILDITVNRDAAGEDAYGNIEAIATATNGLAFMVGFADNGDTSEIIADGLNGIQMTADAGIFLNAAVVVFHGMAAVPASADLNPSDFAFWLDATPGATTFNVKGKDSGGTVRTASIPLT